MTSSPSLFKSLIPSRWRMTLGRLRRAAHYRRLHQRFLDYTMIDKASYCANLYLAEQVRKSGGAVVECGVWRGGMSAGLASLLGNGRTYWLFDSFEGLPDAKPIDGPAAIDWQADKTAPSYYNNCMAEESYAEEAMRLSGASSFKLVKGWFEHTLPGRIIPGGIALLRLDADWYESTMTCLESLFPQVLPGGLILIDDYYAWDGCSRAVHDYLSRTSSTARLRSFQHVCFIEKRTADDEQNSMSST